MAAELVSLHRPISKRQDEEMEKTALKKKRIEICKSVSKEILKKCVLYAVMVAYTFLGGFAFIALEQTNEKQMCIANENLYESMESKAALSFWNMSRSFLRADDEDSQKDRIEELISAFRDNVLDLNYDGLNCSLLGKPNGTIYKWNLASSLLFSVTVFTTVGYGNITPHTSWGRLVCIAYAMCGIPLMFVCLASIGEILGDIFRFIYFNICCLGFCRRRARRPPRSNTRPAIYPATPNDATSDRDAWKNKLVDDNDEHEGEGEEDEEEEMSIPITVTLLVIAGYIGLGVIMFANWEGWDVMSAAYYCFITITTIGFGDVVPGFSFDETGTEMKMIVAALYLLFGMSLMSMSFDLIQYEMRNKVPSKLVAADKADGQPERPTEAPSTQLEGPSKSGWSDRGPRAINDTAPTSKVLELLPPPCDIAIKKRGPRSKPID